MTDHDELRRLAQAATPGPWFVDGPFWWRGGDRDPDCTHVITFGKNRAPVCVMPEDSQRRSEFVDHDAAFIAAANPATVLALLDEHDALTERVRFQRDELERQAADLAAANARADEHYADYLRIFKAKEVTEQTLAVVISAEAKALAENAALRERITELENQRDERWALCKERTSALFACEAERDRLQARVDELEARDA